MKHASEWTVKFAIFGVLGWLSASTVLAQPPEGGEFQVNTYTSGDQGYPGVCQSPSGDTIVVWEGGEIDGDARGIFAQRYDSSGTAIGAEFQVNSYTVDQQQFPAVTCGPSGFVVAWESRGQDGDAYGVFAQRLAADGTKQGAEFQINTQTVERQLGVTLCSAADGAFVVSWQSYEQDGEGSGVFSQRFGSDGAPAGGEMLVNSYTIASQGFPAVACDTTGDFVIVWHSDGQDGDTYGVFGQRFASGGAVEGAEFQVNTYTSYYQQLPAIATLRDGGFVVAWESYDYQDGDSSGVFGQRFASDGQPAGEEFLVNTYTAFSQEAPQVATAANGDFIVAWSSGQDGDGYGVFVQRFGSDGTHHGGEFQANTYTVADQGAFFALGRVLGVAPGPNGDFVVVWQSTEVGGGQDGYGMGVFGQRYEAPCVGDIDFNGRVSIDELIRGTLAALDQTPVGDAAAFDSDANGEIAIDELVTGVGSSVNGC